MYLHPVEVECPVTARRPPFTSGGDLLSARRRLLVPLALLAAAWLAGSTPVRAQPGRPSSPGSHELFHGPLTPEQLREALARFGSPGLPKNLPPELLDQLQRRMKAEGKKLDPKELDQLKKLYGDPQGRKMLEEAAKNFQGQGPSDPQLRSQWGKLFPPPKGNPGVPPELPPPKTRPDPLPPAIDPDPKTLPPPKGVVPRLPDPPSVPPRANPDLPPFPELNPNALPRPDSPFDPNETPRERAMRTFASLWERNVGPLNDTPAVKQMLFDLAAGTEDLKDADGNSFWESLARETGDSTSLADFIDNASLGESWTLPKFDLPSLNWGRSNTDIGRGGDGPSSPPGDSWWSRRGSSSRSGGGSSGFGGFSIPGLEGSWLPVVLLAVVLLGSLVLWRFWYLRDPLAASPYALGGLGPWPIDPRRIATRRHVVLAFEYLSVLVCGPAAKTWTHTTIGQALSELAVTRGEPAILLARLYELARYTPVDEPLTTAELAGARHLVCRLAGLESE
jgi:hypothetical protein